MTNLHKFFHLTAFFFAILIAFPSCEKEDIQIQDHVRNETTTNNSALRFMTGGDETNGTTEDFDCFAFEYPITLLFPDGSDQTVSNDEELETAIDFWYENNEEPETDVTLQFPVNVTLEDGTTQTINGEEALEDLLTNCFGDWDEEEDWCEEDFDEFDCFSFVYPITFITTTGNVTINSDDDFDAFWDTLDEVEDFEVVYLFSIVFEDDGTTLMLNDDDELDEILEECYDEDDEEGEWCDEELDFSDCFEIVYPISLNLPDGSTATVNNDEELEATFEEVDEEDDVTLVYPISLTLTADNSTVVVNNDDEVDAILDDCE